LATDDILIRFKADTGNLKAEFDEIQAGLRKVAQEEKKSGDQAKVTSKDIADAARRREALLKAEINVLKQLEQQSKKAFTPKDIAEFNSRIAQSQKNISLLKGEQDKLSGSNSILGSSFVKLGGLIAAAFSVGQIIAFSNTAVAEFAKAQKAITQLTLVFNGNEGAQRRLLKLSKELQDAFAIDDDVIVGQINFLGLQGRTESQIKKTITAAIQLSAVTGEDLSSAIQKLDGTFEGVTGRLGRLDSRINGLTKSQLANGDAIDIINEKYAGFAQKGLEGVAGALQKIQVESDNTVEKLGEQIAPIKLAAAKFASAWIEGVQLIIDSTKDFFDPDTSILNPFNWFKPDFWKARGATEPGTVEPLIDTQIKILSKFDDRILNIRKAQNQKILEESKNLSQREIDIRKTQIEAIDKILADRHPVIPVDPEEAKRLEDARRKALEVLQREDKERRDAQTALAKFTFDELNKNADKEASLRKQSAEDTIESEKLLQLELLKIDADILEIKLQNAKDTVQDTNAIEIAITDNLRAQAKLRKEILQGGAELHPNREEYDEWVKDTEEANEKVREQFIETFGQIAEAATAFTDILNANTESRIQKLTESEQRQSDSFDKQEEHLQDLLDNHRISQKEFDRQSKALADSRAKAEKQSQDKIKALQLEEAKREKELTIFKIALEIAEAIAALNFVKAAIAGAELIAVIAKPLPAFKKGTKAKQGSGLALVGEEGAELTYLPSQAKVLPAPRTRQYSDVIDSMFDGKLDEYIHKTYVLPALKLQSPNVNINIDYKKLAKANQHPKSISIDNWPEFIDHNPRRAI